MVVWRLTRAPFAASPLDGIGPARGGGRWNSRGTRLAYASSTRSLAILEALVHIDRALAPTDYVFVEVHVPDDAIESIDVGALPAGWRAEPPPPGLREIGDLWVRSARSLGLRVPSAVVPEEFNVLVNPAHPRFGEVRVVGTPHAVILDPRLIP